MGRIVGVKTIERVRIVRVRGGWERHVYTTRLALSATKGWRRDGRTVLSITRMRQRPVRWKDEVRESYQAS